MSRKGTNKSQAGNEGMAMRSNEARGMQRSGEGNGGGLHATGGNGEIRAEDQVFSSDEIAQRAYQIFEREGRTDGRDMDHWLQAEQELRREREQQTGGMNAENAPRSARQHQRSS